MANNQITYSDKTFTNKQLLAIWTLQARLTARAAICKADRAKRFLTKHEYYNKLAQIGRRLRYKDITFTYEDGWGVLRKADGTGVMNATLGDFVKEVETVYGKTFPWYYNDEVIVPTK